MQTCLPAAPPHLWGRSNKNPSEKESVSAAVCLHSTCSVSPPFLIRCVYFSCLFCFLQESTLLASGPVSHPFLSVPQQLPRLPVSAVSHYNVVLLLEELISSPPPSSSLCLPAVGVQRLRHLPVSFPIDTSPSSSGAPTMSITAGVCHDASSSSP